MSSPLPDCIDCGACCFGSHERYIALLPEDRGRALPETALNEIEGRRYMRMAGGRCAQLRPEAGRLVCGVYEERPEACRAFRRGSFECHAARRHSGAEAARLRAPPEPILLPPEPPVAEPSPPPVWIAPAALRRRLSV